MIKKLRIRNFRGIKEGDLELAPLTILLGPNNSGKTAILEALFLAPNPLRDAPYQPEHLPIRIIHSMHETLKSQGFAFILHNYIAKQAEIKCDEYSLKFLRKNSEISVIANEKVKGESLKIGRLEAYTLSLSRGMVKPLMENTLLVSSNLIKEGFEYMKRNWTSIVNLAVCRKIAKEVSELVYEDYIDLTMEPFFGENLAIYAYMADGRRIRLGDLGEGIQAYIIARILYEVEKPEILLWDDVESHFNPKMLLNIAEWFSDLVDGGTQVVLTTHSLEAARTIASLNDAVKICLISLENGILKVKGLTLKDVEEFLKAGVDIRVAETML